MQAFSYILNNNNDYCFQTKSKSQLILSTTKRWLNCYGNIGNGEEGSKMIDIAQWKWYSRHTLQRTRELPLELQPEMSKEQTAMTTRTNGDLWLGNGRHASAYACWHDNAYIAWHTYLTTFTQIPLPWPPSLLFHRAALQDPDPLLVWSIHLVCFYCSPSISAV